MGFVNGSAGYIQIVGTAGADGKVTDTTKQGGLVSVYYFGAMFGRFIGGRFGDRFGQKLAVIIGSLFALVGGALQAGSVSSNMTICARVIAGIGICFINAVSSLPLNIHRKYQVSISDDICRSSQLGSPNWPEPITESPLLLSSFAQLRRHCDCLLVGIWPEKSYEFFPVALSLGIPNPSDAYSPSHGILPPRVSSVAYHGRPPYESVEILAKIRGDLRFNDPTLVAELEQLDAVIRSSKHKRYQFHNVTFGRSSGKLHLGRRVSLAMGIMMMMEWIGILALTVYANTLFQQAGFSASKAAWLSGLCITFDR